MEDRRKVGILVCVGGLCLVATPVTVDIWKSPLAQITGIVWNDTALLSQVGVIYLVLGGAVVVDGGKNRTRLTQRAVLATGVAGLALATVVMYPDSLRIVLLQFFEASVVLIGYFTGVARTSRALGVTGILCAGVFSCRVLLAASPAPNRAPGPLFIATLALLISGIFAIPVLYLGRRVQPETTAEKMN